MKKHAALTLDLDRTRAQPARWRVLPGQTMKPACINVAPRGRNPRARNGRVAGKITTYTAVVLICLVAIVSAPLLLEYSRLLPGGYRVMYTSNESALILNAEGKDVVGPHVTDWTSSGDIIFGVLDGELYFSIDTKDGTVSNFENDVDEVVSYAVAHGISADVAESEIKALHR